MAHPYWPLFDLVIRTPRLEVRYPDDALLVELAALAAKGIHGPDEMPFYSPWTRAEPPDLERSSLKFWWGQRARWSSTSWTFAGAVIVDGQPVGAQDLTGEHFAVTKTVKTGSWLGRASQGKGIGKEMRAAVLHLAFAGLGAERALSGAFEDNRASIAVSRALGYVENGDEIHDREGRPARIIGFKLTREDWERSRREDVEIIGLDVCREWFGA